MAKLASQNIVIQISKAVANDSSDVLNLVDEETVAGLSAVVAELLNDDSIVIEVVSE